MKRLAAALLLAWAACCTAYYLPGTYPQEFFLGQTIQGGSNNFSPAVRSATGILIFCSREIPLLARCTQSRVAYPSQSPMYSLAQIWIPVADANSLRMHLQPK